MGSVQLKRLAGMIWKEENISLQAWRHNALSCGKYINVEWQSTSTYFNIDQGKIIFSRLFLFSFNEEVLKSDFLLKISLSQITLKTRRSILGSNGMMKPDCSLALWVLLMKKF